MRAFWKRTLEEFELEADALLILRTACECFDRAQQAREAIAKDGLVSAGKLHPAVGVEKQAYGLFLRAMRQLGLDIEAPNPIGRPSR
jgi:hypothetical protein